MYEDIISVARVATAFVVCVAILIILAVGGSTYHKHTVIEKIENNAENVTVYLDGVEVPLESINLYYYSIFYDEVNGIVKLTKPVYSRVNPVIVPVV